MAGLFRGRSGAPCVATRARAAGRAERRDHQADRHCQPEQSATEYRETAQCTGNDHPLEVTDLRGPRQWRVVNVTRDALNLRNNSTWAVKEAGSWRDSSSSACDAGDQTLLQTGDDRLLRVFVDDSPAYVTIRIEQDVGWKRVDIEKFANLLINIPIMLPIHFLLGNELLSF